MTGLSRINFEAFAAKFDGPLLKLLTAEVLTTKRSRRFLSGFIGTSRKIILRDLNNSGMAATSPHPSSTGQAALRIDFGGDAWMDQEFSVFQN